MRAIRNIVVVLLSAFAVVGAVDQARHLDKSMTKGPKLAKKTKGPSMSKLTTKAPTLKGSKKATVAPVMAPTIDTPGPTPAVNAATSAFFVTFDGGPFSDADLIAAANVMKDAYNAISTCVIDTMEYEGQIATGEYQYLATGTCPGGEFTSDGSRMLQTKTGAPTAAPVTPTAAPVTPTAAPVTPTAAPVAATPAPTNAIPTEDECLTAFNTAIAGAGLASMTGVTSVNEEAALLPTVGPTMAPVIATPAPVTPTAGPTPKTTVAPVTPTVAPVLVTSPPTAKTSTVTSPPTSKTTAAPVTTTTAPVTPTAAPVTTTTAPVTTTTAPVTPTAPPTAKGADATPAPTTAATKAGDGATPAPTTAATKAV